MTRNQIIEELYRNKTVDKIASKFASQIGPDDRSDFVQHIYLILLNMDETKLCQLYDSDELIYYVISIIRNQAINSNSEFHRLYNSQVLTEQFTFENYQFTDEN